MRNSLVFILEKITSLFSGITIEKAQVHSNGVKSSDVVAIMILLA